MQEIKTSVASENCVPFSACNTEINDALIDETNHVYITMSMYIWFNMVIIIQMHQEAYGSLKEMKFQLIWEIMIINLNHFNT